MAGRGSFSSKPRLTRPYLKTVCSIQSMASQNDDPEINSLEDLALLNEENAIRIEVNGQEKFLASNWLQGNGRASSSILAKQILGTKQGLSGSTALTIDDELVPVFDMLILWMAIGNDYLQASLTEENASDLFALASYYNLQTLEKAIQEEQRRRDEAARQEEEKERQRLVLILARLRAAGGTGGVRCASCRAVTTVAPSYKGNRPRCWSCRGKYVYNRDDPYDYDESDSYGHWSDSSW